MEEIEEKAERATLAEISVGSINKKGIKQFFPTIASLETGNQMRERYIKEKGHDIKKGFDIQESPKDTFNRQIKEESKRYQEDMKAKQKQYRDQIRNINDSTLPFWN